jgi:ribosomal-protein-alanine N-acetyltransferase
MTERLVLRAFAAADIDELHVLFTDAGVRRWLLDDQVVPREWVAEEIVQSQARFAEGSCGLWTLRERRREGIIGFVGFRPFFDPPELQLLYGLMPSRWGHGLATEAAAAAIDHAFAVLGMREIRAATDTPNVDSIRVLERLGMRELRRSEDGSHGTVFFELRPGDWAARRSL